MAWTEVRHPKTDRLMFKVDLQRQLVEVSDKGHVAVVDLTRLSICCKTHSEPSKFAETFYANEVATDGKVLTY